MKRPTSKKKKPAVRKKRTNADKPIYYKGYWIHHGPKGTSIEKEGQRLSGLRSVEGAKRVIDKLKNPSPAKKRPASKKKPASFKQAYKKAGFGRKRTTAKKNAPVRRKRVNDRKRNPAAPAGIQAMHKAFLGRPIEEAYKAKAPESAPANLTQLGILSWMKAGKGSKTLSYKWGESSPYVLCADARGNLWIVAIAPFTPGKPKLQLGEISQLGYIAAKSHIESGEVVEYVHKFGEEGGAKPTLKTDREGMLLIHGGDYFIRADGIND